MREIARPPSPPSRLAGGLAVLSATLGSGAVALACIDVARSARFEVAAAFWQATPASGSRAAGTLVGLAAAVVAAVGLGIVAAWARGGTRLLPAAWGAAAVAVLAALAHVRHALAHVFLLPAFLPGDWFGLRGAAAAIGLVSVVVAIAGARASEDTASRLAPLAAVAPLLVCAFVLPSMAACVPPHVRRGELLDALDALVARGDVGRRDLALALIPGLLGALAVRARPAVATFGGAWLALGAALVLATRPLAADAADRTHAFVIADDPHAWYASVGPRLPDAAGCETREHAPTLALDGPRLDGTPVRDPATLREWLDTLRREHAILHPREPFPGVLVLRPEGALSRAVADDVAWLRVVDEAEYTELRIELDARASWSTRSRGALETTVVCQRTPIRPPLEAAAADPSIRWSALAGLDASAIE